MSTCPAMPARNEAGFSLVEVLIAMAIMLVVLAGTFSAMTEAMSSHEAAKQTLDMNRNLRAAMDLVVRDMLQVGQGLPTGRRVGVPNGAGAAAIRRPGPAASAPCAGVGNFPAAPSLPAVQVGPNLGPPVDGVCTDVITTIAIDGAAEGLNVSSIAADGRSLRIHPDVDISATGSNLRAGELVMLRKNSMTVLLQVTGVAGQMLSFASGDPDPLGLNQVGAAINGTISNLSLVTPADAVADQPHPGPDGVPGTGDEPDDVILEGPSTISRVRMTTYYVDVTTDPANPRLMRQLGGNPANAMAFNVQTLRLTYDLVAPGIDATGVRMVGADYTVGGGCAPFACSENLVRKVNVVLALRSHKKASTLDDYYRNTLFTQVSLRSLSFVDEYQ